MRMRALLSHQPLQRQYQGHRLRRRLDKTMILVEGFGLPGGGVNKYPPYPDNPCGPCRPNDGVLKQCHP